MSGRDGAGGVGNSGGGPGYNSLAFSTEDNERQLVPVVNPLPLLGHAFC